MAYPCQPKMVLALVAQPFRDKKMPENETNTTNSVDDSATKPAESRTPRSIRFSDSEWAGVDKEAKARGMTAAELVRHAAVSMAAGKSVADSPAFPPEIAAQIERIYRGVYLLATLQRDEMVHNGRQNELETITNAASEAQASIRAELEKRSEPRP